MVIIALYFFYRARKIEKERLVTFAPTESKKRYKNGAEIKAESNSINNDSREDLLAEQDEDKK